MQHQINSVIKFHITFGLNINTKPKANLGHDTNILRFNLMKEENEEYLEAVQNKDLVEIADALGDMLYILCGTIVSQGFRTKLKPFSTKFNEVI